MGFAPDGSYADGSYADGESGSYADGESGSGRSYPVPRDAVVISPLSTDSVRERLVPAMLERGHGAVVNVTSMAQVTTWPGMGHYCATKAALALVTETLRLELTDSGVHVLEVAPGPVDTAIQGESRLVPGFDAATRRVPMGDPAKLAKRRGG